MRKGLIAIFVLAICQLCPAQGVLNNDAIIKLIKAGMSEDIIVSTVNASQGAFDTSANGLITLKAAGVSDKVLSAIVVKATIVASAAAPAAAASSGSALPPGVDSIGVYYQDKDGSWQEVMTEAVTKKTGGALKFVASNGLIKEDINGNLKGKSSRLKMTLPAKFIMYMPEGRSPGEYELVRLHAHDKDREFRSSTGGVIHSSSGAAKDSIDFTPKKIAPRVYEIVLDMSLGKGEYGYLAPNDTGNQGNAASSGKMYTFSIAE